MSDVNGSGGGDESESLREMCSDISEALGPGVKVGASFLGGDTGRSERFARFRLVGYSEKNHGARLRDAVDRFPGARVAHATGELFVVAPLQAKKKSAEPPAVPAGPAVWALDARALAMAGAFVIVAQRTACAYGATPRWLEELLCEAVELAYGGASSCSDIAWSAILWAKTFLPG